MEHLSSWQLFRLHTLLSLLRSQTSTAQESDGDGGDCDAVRVRHVHFSKESVAKGFIDKGYDALSDTISKLGMTLEVCCTPENEGIDVSLFESPTLDGEGDAEGRVHYATVDFLDATKASIEAKIPTHATTQLHAVLSSVADGATSLWSNCLGLEREGGTGGSDPMASMMGAMDSSTLKMMLMGATVSSGPKPLTEAEGTLRRTLRSTVVTVAPATSFSYEARLDAEGRVEVAVTAPTDGNPIDTILTAVIGVLDTLAVFLPTLGGVAKSGSLSAPAPKRKDRLPGLLLLAAMISADRKKKSAQLKVPHQLLEQALWFAEKREHEQTLSGDTATDMTSYVLVKAFRTIRKDVEFPSPVDEEPREEESDEEYFNRIKPKTYLDTFAEYLPLY